jgi:hypothetical protein
MPILFWLPLIYASALLELAASRTDNRSRAHLATVSGDMTDAKSNMPPRHGVPCPDQPSDNPDVRGQWLMMAQTWFKLAENAGGVPPASGRCLYR